MGPGVLTLEAILLYKVRGSRRLKVRVMYVVVLAHMSLGTEICAMRAAVLF